MNEIPDLFVSKALFSHSRPHIESQASAAVPKILKLFVHLRENPPIVYFNPAERPADALDSVDVGSDASGPDDAHQ